MSGVNSSVETVNAAAAAIVSAESRVQQVTIPRRRWGACFSLYWCFGSPKNGRRISHAILVPEPTLSRSDTPARPRENPTQQPALVVPFIAPPPSPASFLQSELASNAQSPAGPLSLSALSASSYSPTGSASVFAVGPYAHETQLVSPPVFSAFTTEPSTAPFTPPPEPVHLTTPSSPEVPFAKLLNGNANELQSCQFYPGSPIGHLISPSSACSGTSSPFPDQEFPPCGRASFPSFPIVAPPNILSAERVVMLEPVPWHPRKGGSLPDGQIATAAPATGSAVRSQNIEHVVDHRVSFELNVEEVARCLEKKTTNSGEFASELVLAEPVGNGVQITGNKNTKIRACVDETCPDLPDKARSSVSLPVPREFKFDNSDGANAEPDVGSDWWANEKVTGIITEHQKNWAFFPVAQPGG